MKVIAIIGSPRRHGNTELLAEHTLKAVAESGIETEIVPLAGKDIRPCTACLTCSREENCPLPDDLMPIFNQMKTADGIILASPVYFGSCTALLKGLMERTGYLARFHGDCFKGKAGGPLVVARRAGQNFTVAQIDFWFHILGIIEPGSSYWNMAFGRAPGEVLKDEEGMQTAWNFGKNLAGLLLKIHQ
jgi:multimeric flavodoxin WrbA